MVYQVLLRVETDSTVEELLAEGGRGEYSWFWTDACARPMEGDDVTVLSVEEEDT